jgi:hypothetical protein
MSKKSRNSFIKNREDLRSFLKKQNNAYSDFILSLFDRVINPSENVSFNAVDSTD